MYFTYWRTPHRPSGSAHLVIEVHYLPSFSLSFYFSLFISSSFLFHLCRNFLKSIYFLKFVNFFQISEYFSNIHELFLNHVNFSNTWMRSNLPLFWKYFFYKTTTYFRTCELWLKIDELLENPWTFFQVDELFSNWITYVWNFIFFAKIQELFVNSWSSLQNL